MKIYKGFLVVFLSVYFSFPFSSSSEAFFEKSTKKVKQTTPPGCNNNQVHCPKGFKAICPKQYKPSCVFLGTSYRPACLANSQDDTTFNYHLDKIKCEKS